MSRTRYYDRRPFLLTRSRSKKLIQLVINLLRRPCNAQRLFGDLKKGNRLSHWIYIRLEYMGKGGGAWQYQRSQRYQPHWRGKKKKRLRRRKSRYEEKLVKAKRRRRKKKAQQYATTHTILLCQSHVGIVITSLAGEIGHRRFSFRAETLIPHPHRYSFRREKETAFTPAHNTHRLLINNNVQTDIAH